MSASHRELPHEPAVERAVLGSIIADPKLLDAIPHLEPSHFYDPKHRVVFESIRNVQSAGRPLDLATIEAQIVSTGKLGAIGGPAFLGELALLAPDLNHVAGWVRIVVDHAQTRDLAIAHSAVADAYRAGRDPGLPLADLERIKASYAPSGPDKFGRPFVEFVGADEPNADPSEVFDAHGLIVTAEPSLIIGDPKVGKTLLLEDLMLHMAAGRREWCGLRIYRRPRILLILREDSERTTQRRLWQLARGAGIEHWELADHLVVDTSSPLYFDDAKLTAKLEGQLSEFDICAIDSLSTIHNADENSVERMAPIMNRWRDMSLGTKTAIPLVHHFRKRGEAAQASNGTGSVLQRARGSSLIAATTRHAVGVEKGPGDDEIIVSVESNHEVDVEPFVIRRRFGTDDRGQKFIRHERAGNLVDAREARLVELLDPIILAIVGEVGFDGIGARDLRKAAIDRVQDRRGGRGVRVSKIDEACRRLEAGRAIAQHEGRWRVARSS